MKRILFVAFATTLLAASCSKTEVINPEVNQIGFSTKMAKLTKASGTAADADADGIENLQAQDFRLWAYADFEDPYTTAPELDNIYDGMVNLNIAYNDETKNWAPEDEDYYWPGKGKALRFFAVSGEQSSTAVSVAINRTTSGEGTSAVTKVAPTVTISDYVVNHENPNTDLMVADFVRQDQNTVVNDKEGVVALSFRHALTKVEFLFKTDTEKAEDAVYVQSVTVEGLNTQSTLVVNDEGESLAEKFVWGTRSEEKTFTDDYMTETVFPSEILHLDGETKGATDKTAMLLDNDAEPFCTWLAMPQSVVGKKVKVVFVIGTRQFERSFELDKGLTEWGVNQYVRYTATLVPNKISFDSSVDDWSTTDVEDKEL